MGNNIGSHTTTGVDLNSMNVKEFCQYLSNNKLIRCKISRDYCIINDIKINSSYSSPTVGLFRYSCYTTEKMCQALIDLKLLRGYISGNHWVT
jgi:hypothetical protein